MTFFVALKLARRVVSLRRENRLALGVILLALHYHRRADLNARVSRGIIGGGNRVGAIDP